MTDKEAAKVISEHCYFSNLVPVGKEALNRAIKSLGRTSPCDLCRYNPPSSGDGKPCSMCPACAEVTNND